jgi:hypothetical protein
MKSANNIILDFILTANEPLTAGQVFNKLEPTEKGLLKNANTVSKCLGSLAKYSKPQIARCAKTNKEVYYMAIKTKKRTIYEAIAKHPTAQEIFKAHPLVFENLDEVSRYLGEMCEDNIIAKGLPEYKNGKAVLTYVTLPLSQDEVKAIDKPEPIIKVNTGVVEIKEIKVSKAEPLKELRQDVTLDNLKSSINAIYEMAKNLGDHKFTVNNKAAKIETLKKVSSFVSADISAVLESIIEDLAHG